VSHPRRLGRYELLGLLGQGGMGAVYKARDPSLDRVVAVKTINPLLLAGGATRGEYLERFRREARAAGRLSHPNIVSVFDLGLDEATDTPFIVMEYVAGVSLEAVLADNPVLPLDQALEIVEQVASALEEAHRGGVVHRDVKPANVFLDGRVRVKVGDFGVARLLGSELTQTGVGLGTPGYAAPEVVRGGIADARSDVFALGVLAYRLVTGQRPFASQTRESLAFEILEREPPPPRALRAEVPESVSQAILRALAKSPEARTPSAEAFARELRATAPTGTLASPAPAPARAAPRGRRLLLAALLALALGLGAGAFLLLRGARGTESSGTGGPPAAPVPATTAARPRPGREGARTGAAEDAEKALQILREAQRQAEQWARDRQRAEEPSRPGRGQDEKARGEKKGRGKGKGKPKDKP
jgi:serine/threonine-protein kinase